MNKSIFNEMAPKSPDTESAGAENWPTPGHILSRTYNCTTHGNQKINNATIAHFTLHIFILQLHNL